MSATDSPFPWMRPRTIGLDAQLLAKVHAYAEHSLPGYPEEAEVPAEMRGRVLAEIHTLRPLPPCEEDEPGPDIDCLTCEDTGDAKVGEYRFPFPCPDCPRGDWTWGHELNDDMRYDR